MSVSFCSVNKFICIIFLDPTYVLSYDFFLCLTSLSMIISRFMLWEIALFYSFTRLRNIPLYICATSLSIPLLMDTWVSSYIGYCEQCCSEHWDTCIFQIMVFCVYICQGVRLQSHMLALFLVFKANSILYSTVAVQIYIPTKSQRISLSPHAVQHLLFVDCFNDGNSDWCEVILYCSFDLHFSDNK